MEGGAEGGGDAGNDFNGNAGGDQLIHLFAAPAKNKGVAAFEANDEFSFECLIDEQLADILLWHGVLARHFAGDADVHIPLCKVALRELRDREIRAEFDRLTIGQQRSARQAVAELAGRYGIASRHVWRLLKQTDKTAPGRPLN